MHARSTFLLLALAGACTSDTAMPLPDATVTCAADADCDDGLFCTGSERCAPSAPSANRFGCVAGAAPCSGGCDEAAGNCGGACVDADGDGFDDVACGGTDCDDDDANRFPGNTEVCDAANVDEDCNPATLGDRDADMDGVVDAACCNVGATGLLRCGRDCDDAAAGVSPTVPEVCNGLDDDCDGVVDEGVRVVLYDDGDGDGFGRAEASSVGCPGAPNTSTRAGDCDDTLASVSPGATESCNDVDDDCDGLVDDIVDGVIVCRAGTERPCLTGCGVAGNQHCLACASWDTCAAPEEVCNGCDDDVDGATDEAFDCTFGTTTTCTTLCGTEGTQLCTGTCERDACRAPRDICNYCDDDADGDFTEEAVLATDSYGPRLNCGATSGSGRCFLTPGIEPISRFELLDGTSVTDSGEVWFTPTDFVQGWGPTVIDLEVEVEVLAGGGQTMDTALGEWELMLGSGAGPTGTPTEGLLAVWEWAGRYPDFVGTGVPLPEEDIFWYRALSGGVPVARERDGAPLEPGLRGTSAPAATRANGPGTSRQRFRLTYTPDDPLTRVSEESVRLEAGPAGGALTLVYSGTGPLKPANDLPIGTGPLRLGVRAASRVGGPYFGSPTGPTMGALVRVQGSIWMERLARPGVPVSYDEYITIELDRVCPPAG